MRPFGSKYGMGDRIKGMRQYLGSVVFGVLDGDFGPLADPIATQPRTWQVEEQLFGWRWKRKEIENYILDPNVVSSALGLAAPPAAAYEEILKAAGDRITAYQAARTYLGLVQRRYRPLPTSFGRPRGSDNHRFPDALDEASCRTEFLRTINDHQSSLECDEQRFDELLAECRSGGPRLAAFLCYFAGKDLMWAIDEPLRQLGFLGCGDFRERILLGVEQTKEPVETWIPEWGALREAVIST